jgi:hypothetical protein
MSKKSVAAIHDYLGKIKRRVTVIKVRGSVADPGCLSRIRIFSSRASIKEFMYFNPKKWF